MGDPVEPGQIVADRYQIEALIGAGGIAEVYRVRHVELGSLHAMKVLAWRRPSLAERFEREGRFQAQLGHPNVVTVTDFVRFDGLVAMVMEYVDGPTLEQLLNEQGALPPDEALALFVPILAAVTAAHDNQVWHRDLKPANVLLARSSGGYVPKVADFGIAKFVADDLGSGTKMGVAMGTPGYMPPEQIRDSASVDGRADIFALGAMLYEMYTGRRAFGDANGDVSLGSTLDRPVPRLSVPGVPAEVVEAVSRAMAKERDERFADCREFARALGVADHPLFAEARGAAGGLAVSVRTTGSRPTTPVSLAPTRGRAIGLALVLSGASLAALGAVALWVSLRDDPAPAPPPALDLPPPTVTLSPVPPPQTPQPLIVGPKAPAPEPEPEPVPEPEPEPEAAVEPPPEPAPVAAPEPPPPPIPEPAPAFDPMPLLAGTWTGSANSGGFELRFLPMVDGRLNARARFGVGGSGTQIALTGAYDPATKRLALRSDEGVWFQGTVADGRIRGEYALREGAKALPWEVHR